jgi:uncharacterized membrane protein YgcG
MATPATGNVEKIISVKFDSQQAVRGIMSLNQQLEQNNADLKQMADAGKKGTKAYADLEQETKALKSQKRDLSQMVQNEIKQQTTLDGSLRNLRAQLSNLTKQYDALSRAERENVNVGGKLKNQINQVTKEIKDAEYGTERYYRNVGNYQNAILGALGINGRFAQSIMGLTNMQGGFSGALAGMGASVKAFGTTLMGLLTNPVFLAIAGIAGAGLAFKWFWDYNLGVEKAMRLTREFTGLAGDELSNLRAEIAGTADTYEKEYEEVLKSVDFLMANFHMTGQEAIETINKGFQAGADLNGDYLQKLQQYGPAFHDAGIEAEQLVAIIQQTRSGIFTDQGLEAIRMGSTRIREMSTTTSKALKQIGIDVDEMESKLADGSMTTFDALQEVAKKLQEIPRNAKEYGEVITSVFGRQGRFASQEMIEGLAGINTSLEELMETTGEYGELTDQLREKDVELEKEMSTMFGNGTNGFEELKLKAEIFIKDGLIQAVKWLKEQVKWFKNVWNSSKAVRIGLSGLIALWRVMQKVSYIPLKMIITGLKTIGDILVVLSNAFGTIKKNIARAFEGLVEIFRGIKNLDPEQVWKGVQQAASGAWDTVKAVGAGMVDTFSAAFGNVKGMAVETFNDVKDIANEAFDMIDYQFDMSEGGGGSSSSSGNGGGSSRTPAGGGGGGGGGNRGGSGNRGGGGSSSNKPATAKKEKTPEELAQEAYNKRIEALIKKGTELHRRALEAQSKDNLKAIEELAEMQRQELYKTYGDREQYEGEALEAWDRMWQDIEDKRIKAIEEYNAKLKKTQKDQADQLMRESQQLADAILAGQEEGSAKQMEYRLKILQLQQQAELAELDANEDAKTNRKEWWEQMRTAIIEKYRKEQTDIEQEYAQKQKEIEISKLEASSQIAGAMSQLVESAGEENKEALALSKMLALGEIMISQAVAIANAVKAGSNAITPWQMIAQIATSITAVTVAMAQAFKSLNEAKFATGGYVRGAGTGTSDSIPVRVSNGESIMNANTTAMFSGLLSSLNQLGGGVPIQVQQTASSLRGEDMLARAVARGVAMLPAPVVSVEDINRGQRQVEVMNERATL